MSSVLVRAIDPHDDVEMPRHLAFQEAHGTARHSLAEFRVFVPTIYDTLTLVAEEASDEDRLVGCALAHIHTEQERDIVMCNLFAEPGRADVLRALVERITVWSSISELRSLYVHVSNPSDQARADLEAAGLRFGNDRYKVRRLLTQDDVDLEVPVPDGVTLTSMAEHPELEGAFVELWNRGLADVPSTMQFPEATRDQVLQYLEIEDKVWPERIRIALDAGGELLGFVAMLRHAKPGARKYGHRLTAVAPHARGRGIAMSLKRDAIRWAARDGATELFASNDSDNAPMRAVNHALGYEPQFTIALYELPLRGDTPT